ncbi:hypothetical protein RFI_10353 [Reticulomyxa filosa]|uniref:Uncharacterized protein n=1 Tax=Reticulomyxa filosa TaxID=46433 RepID=X6NLB8_RETFI|nr:hypothetical protein RFI_10353 [Reticulomyxa filosa]|eukprot:ETO26781.1 hypothetical protein RFI_10353 [Reticulomyxa filosa]
MKKGRRAEQNNTYNNVIHRKSLQLLRSAFPDHIFLNEHHNVTLGIYMNKGGSNQSLYRLKEDEPRIPIIVNLIDSQNNKVGKFFWKKKKQLK